MSTVHVAASTLHIAVLFAHKVAVCDIGGADSGEHEPSIEVQE
ncbi:MAG: hypothetical protein ABI670_00040 [Chloroflexota bacterium]